MKIINHFNVIGIDVKTTNEDGKAAEDIGKLWERFFSEDIANKIPNKLTDENEIFAIYTDYENNFKGSYRCIIGQRVDNLEDIPERMTGFTVENGKYKKFTAKGEMPIAVVKKWQEIWAQDEMLNRVYTSDFELYTDKSQNGNNSIVDIYIAV